MPTVTIPNRPAPSDPRDIAAIIANFDAITNVINGNLDGSNFPASMKDGSANNPTLRSLGYGPLQAASGNDSRLVYSVLNTDFLGHQTQLKVITGHVTAVPTGWGTYVINFSPFPTLCAMAFVVPNPVTNGASAISFSNGGFANGVVTCFLNNSLLQDYNFYGLAVGY